MLARRPLDAPAEDAPDRRVRNPVLGIIERRWPELEFPEQPGGIDAELGEHGRERHDRRNAYLGGIHAWATRTRCFPVPRYDLHERNAPLGYQCPKQSSIFPKVSSKKALSQATLPKQASEKTTGRALGLDPHRGSAPVACRVSRWHVKVPGAHASPLTVTDARAWSIRAPSILQYTSAPATGLITFPPPVVGFRRGALRFSPQPSHVLTACGQ